jgi:hypothetical protein
MPQPYVKTCIDTLEVNRKRGSAYIFDSLGQGHVG